MDIGTIFGYVIVFAIGVLCGFLLYRNLLKHNPAKLAKLLAEVASTEAKVDGYIKKTTTPGDTTPMP